MCCSGPLCPKMYYKLYRTPDDIRFYLFPCLLKKIPSKKELREAMKDLWNRLEGKKFTCQAYFTSQKKQGIWGVKLVSSDYKEINEYILDLMYCSVNRLDRSTLYCRIILHDYDGFLIDKSLEPVEYLFKMVDKKLPNQTKSLSHGFYLFRKYFVPKVKPDTIAMHYLQL